MGLAVAGLEHRHRRLVRVQHAVLQHLGGQGIDQWLQLHTALADPLRQRRAGDCQSGTFEDRLLPIQRQVIQVLGHQHLGQQPGGWNALVDDVRCDRRLHQLLAAVADPFATDVALDGEHARLVIELLGHVLADAFHDLAAAAGGVLGLVADLAARQVRGQHLPLRCLLVRQRCLAGLDRFDLGGQCRQVGVQRLLEQALLLGVERFRLGLKLQPLQDRVLVRELVDQRLLEDHIPIAPGDQLILEVDFGTQTAQCLAQLLWVQGVDGRVGDHGT